jgi:hypothetical protein
MLFRDNRKLVKKLCPALDNRFYIRYNYQCCEREPLAQLVEHLTFNQGVGGSSPPWLTIFV